MSDDFLNTTENAVKDGNFGNKVIALLSSLLVVALLIASFAMKDKDFSESENRTLASFPEFEFSELADGEYFSKVTTYLKDQFPGRDGLMALYAGFQQFLLKTEINNIYLCEDDYLIEKEKNTDNAYVIKKLSRFISKINEDINVSVMLAPTSLTVNEDKLPLFASGDEEDNIAEIYAALDELSKDVNLIELSKILKDNNGVENESLAGASDSVSSEVLRLSSQLYYKTDHHWTSFGAYYAYVSYANSLGLSVNEMKDYDISVVGRDFYGSFFTKVGLKNLTSSDVITAFYPLSYDDLSVTYNGKTSYDNEGNEISLFNTDYLSLRDKYSYFLNNQNTIVEIVNPNITDGSHLVLVKDSYANSLIPFLTDYYAKITVIDTRYMLGASDFINANDVTDVLILFNMGTVYADPALDNLF